MQQYSPKNQAFLLAQMPTATDVRPFKAWKAAGRSVRKGEKALRVWIPKLKGETADPAALTETERERRYVRGPVFDISQTKECAPRHRKAAETDRRHAAEFDAMDRAFAEYHAAIAADEIPADLEFDIWYELREESRVAHFNASLDAFVLQCSGPDAISGQSAGTIAIAAGLVIAEYQHIDAYPPISGGSQELDTIEQETASAVSEPHQHDAYQRGIDAAHHEYRTLDESLIRAMHAALVEQLSPPPSYPAGIAGLDYAHRLGRLHAYSYLLNADPEPHPACFHSKRRYNVSTVTSAEELTEKLTNHGWCLCQGFELGHALFLNDATHEDGAGEYAIIDTRTMKQIESITFSWCKPEKARQYIEAAAAGTMECPWPMGILDPHRLDYNKPYPHCAHCR